MIVFQDLKHNGYMLQMFLCHFIKDKNIIEVDDNKFTKERFQYIVHQMRKSVGGIGQPKGHHQPFI